MNDQTLCMCQQFLASIQGGGCCNNCGQQHYGAIPCPVQSGSCCPAKPCMLCSSYKDQNIFSLLDELPTKDLNGNMNPAHILANLNGERTVTPYGNNNYLGGGAEPYSRSYSLASSHQHDQHRMVTYTPFTTPVPLDIQTNYSETPVITPAVTDQRTYMVSCKSVQIKECGASTFFDNNSGTSGIHIDQIISNSHHSTTSLDEESDSSLYGRLGTNLAKCSTISTMGGCPISRCSLPWVQSMCSCSSSHTAMQQEQLQSVINGEESVLGEQPHNTSGESDGGEQRDDISIDSRVGQYSNRLVRVSIAEQDNRSCSDDKLCVAQNDNHSARGGILKQDKYVNMPESENQITSSFAGTMGGGSSVFSNRSIGYAEKLLKKPAGELTQMCHGQDSDLCFLHEHELQQDDDNDSLTGIIIGPMVPIKEQTQFWQTSRPRYHGTNKRTSLIKPRSASGNTTELSRLYMRMQHGDGASQVQTTPEDNYSDNSLKNINENNAGNRQNAGGQCGCQSCCSCIGQAGYAGILDEVGGNFNFDGATNFSRPSAYPSPTKSAPTVQTTCKPCDCSFLSSADFGLTTASAIGGSQGLSDRDRHLNTRLSANHRRIDMLSAERMAMLRKEFEDAEKSRQMIADAMAELTIKHRDEVVARAVKQTKDDARKAEEQRQRDTEAAEATAALQRENDTIISAMRRIEAARIAAEERKELELLAIEDLQRQEEQLSKLKSKEIDLTEAAIKRQAVAEKAVLVLRQLKADAVERAKQFKEQALYTSRLEEMRIADYVQRRKAAAGAATDVMNLKHHEEAEAKKHAKDIEVALQRQQKEEEALAAAETRRRRELTEDADAERRIEIKRAAWNRELQAIQAANRRKDAEEEAILSATKRREEDAVLEERHKAALLESANRRKREEQEFQAQKKKLIQEYADERAKKTEIFKQEQQRKQTASRIQSQPAGPQNVVTPPSQPPESQSRRMTTNVVSRPAAAAVDGRLENSTPMNLDPAENAKRRATAEAALARRSDAQISLVSGTSLKSEQGPSTPTKSRGSRGSSPSPAPIAARPSISPAGPKLSGDNPPGKRQQSTASRIGAEAAARNASAQLQKRRSQQRPEGAAHRSRDRLSRASHANTSKHGPTRPKSNVRIRETIDQRAIPGRHKRRRK